jgi:hypothetical protein
MRADHFHMACQNARLTPRLTPHLIQGSCGGMARLRMCNRP